MARIGSLERPIWRNRLAIAVAKSRKGRLDFVSSFIADAKASGLVQWAIDRGGLPGIQVAA